MSATSKSPQTDFDTGVPSPAIASIDAVDGRRRTISVRWAAGNREGRVDQVDLSPLIGTHRFYAPLRNDYALFETAHLIDDGHAVAWGDGAIDMSAASVERLADEAMTGADFCAFLEKHSLTHQAAAAVLGRSKRQIEYYLRGEHIPRVVALACIGYEARRDLMAGMTAGDWHGVVWPSASSGTQVPTIFSGVCELTWQNAQLPILTGPHHGFNQPIGGLIGYPNFVVGGAAVYAVSHPSSQVMTSTEQLPLAFRQYEEAVNA
jgi:hypothetical protein